jgi:preprotein translocase subunit SecY
MFSNFLQAFKTPDLRKKLIFTGSMIVLFRLGSFIPTPGVDYKAVTACVNQGGSEDLLGLINLFSGGALLQLSIFALGIMPYITASIIVQLLRVVIPRFEYLHKEGQAGQAKMTQYTRYLTIGLAILESTTILVTAMNGTLFGGQCDETVIPNSSPIFLALMVIIMTAGTGVIMWFAELITERGIGNGMSILIFTSICAKFLPGLWSIGEGSAGWGIFGVIVIFIIAIIGIVVFVEQSQRRIPVQYAKRMVGRKQLGGTTTYIPIKINISGVVPIIFASSLLAMPTMLAQFGNAEAGWVQWIRQYLGSQQSPVHIALYGLLTFFFCFFYASITFNPDEIADNTRKYNGFIPGIRAGKPTAEYLQFVLNRINTVGATYLALLALIPTFMFMWAKVSGSMPFGGTTLLIIVGVGLDTVKQINSQLQQHHYEGFLS